MSRNALPHPAFAGTVSALVYDKMILPGKHEVRVPFQIAGGQVLAMGSVLGAVTATGKLILSLAAAVDGSQVPIAILVEDLDTTQNGNADVNHSVYVEGKFNETALVYGTGHTANTCRLPLRNVGIYLEIARYSYL